MSNLIKEKTKKQPNILVTGASGYIGQSFLSEIKNLNYVGIKHNSKLNFINENIIKLDMRNNNRVKEVFNKYKPNIVYHFAALTSPEINEKNIKLAKQTHLDITQNILENISSKGHIIYLSTDKVFDGTNLNPDEDAPTNPQWVYGKLKLLCENLIKEKLYNYHILRLPIVHSIGSINSGSFIDKALIKIKNAEQVKIYDNVFRCYVLLSDLTKLLKILIYDNHYGIYHVGTKMMSYYDRVIDICRKNRIKYKGLIQSVTGSAKPMKQNLNTEKVKTIFNYEFT